MAKNVEAKLENETAADRRQKYLGKAIEVTLRATLKRKGYVLGGINIKMSEDEALVTIKIPSSGEGPLIGFMGGKTVASALRKMIQALEDNKLTLRPDKWALSRFDKSEDEW